MEFNWEEFKASDKIAVHCKTEEEAIDFCKQMHEYGMEWINGESYLDNPKWEVNKERTVYYPYGMFGSAGFCKKTDTVLEWREYMKKEFTKADLKVGMLAVLRDGEKVLIQENESDGIVYAYSDGYNCFGNDLKNKYSNTQWDILEIWSLREGGNPLSFTKDDRRLLWKREEKTWREIKIEEIETTIENLKKQVKELKGK